MLLLCLPGEVRASSAAAPGQGSCVTDSCHAAIVKSASLHGPVGMGECLSCHVQKGKHKFEPIRNAGKLCSQCHEEMNTQAYVHDPVNKGSCLLCHDPHGSPNRFQLRAPSGELCFRCHDRTRFAAKFVHGPVAVGSCVACHSPHQSRNKALLISPGNEVCYSCHQDKGEELRGAKFVHAPVAQSCVNCHNPHGGNFRYNLLVEGADALCFTCHGDKAKSIKEAAVPHQALGTERKCLACHEPHGSRYVKQLIKEPADLCLGCHNREYNGANGRISNIRAVLDHNTDHHGPIRQKDCSGCHNAHGSPNFRMLREQFPQVFYAGYNPENYRLCFQCHEKNLANEERTRTMTNFRNGDQNLHFVHVNKTVKGRTCRACHDAHATNNPRHVRNDVPFAKWQLPIGFTRTDKGGTCLPGCHQLYKYDRDSPVPNRPPVSAR